MVPDRSVGHAGQMNRQRRSDRGSVVWWAVAVIGCALVMLFGLTLVAQGALRSAQAQAVADLASLAAVGADQSGASSPGTTARIIVARNGASLSSVDPSPAAWGERRWRVRVRYGPIEASAAAEPDPDPVHP